MLALGFLIYSAAVVVRSQYQNVDINSCKVGLQLSCGDDNEDQFVTPDHSNLQGQGRPGKRGPRGIQGPIGPIGAKGQKGEPCNCDDRLTEIQNQLDALKVIVGRNPSCPQLKFTFPTRDHTTEWIKLTNPIPVIEEITVCAWITPPLNTNVDGALASYATSNNANDFTLLFPGNKRLEVYVHGGTITVSASFSQRTYVCAAVHVIQGRVKFYQDGEHVDSGTIPSSKRSRIQGGGIFLIGQEQDSVGGGFDSPQGLKATIENFYLWYRELSENDVRSVFNRQCSCPSLTPDVDLRPGQIQLYGSLTSESIESCS